METNKNATSAPTHVPIPILPTRHGNAIENKELWVLLSIPILPTRHGNRLPGFLLFFPTSPFRSYLRGMETAFPNISTFLKPHSDPTYEAWKLASKVAEIGTKNIPILPTRHGNSMAGVAVREPVEIPILPTRHGNAIKPYA